MSEPDRVWCTFWEEVMQNEQEDGTGVAVGVNFLYFRIVGDWIV